MTGAIFTLLSNQEHTCQPTHEMSIYTHFRHFLLLHTHTFHILNNLPDNLVLKYAHGLARPKMMIQSEISMA